MKPYRLIISPVVFAVLMAVMLVLSSGTAEALMIEMNLSRLSTEADSVVEGTVMEQKSYWNAQKTGISTDAVISVNDNLKGGNAKGSKVTVTVPGGEVGGVRQTIEHSPLFTTGSNVIVFLKQNADSKFRVHGMEQGMFKIEKDKAGKDKVGDVPVDKFKQNISLAVQGKALQTLDSDSPSPTIAKSTITTVSPNIASAGTDTTVTITGSGFGTKGPNDVVQFYYMTSGGYNYYLEPDAYISWTDTQIVCTVPAHDDTGGYPASASSGWVKMYIGDVWYPASGGTPFTVTFGNGKAKWPGANPSVPYYVNPANPNVTPASALAEVQVAAQTWTNDLANFSFSYAGYTDSTSYGYNSKNEVLWKNLNDGGVLARACWWVSGSTIVDADIELNTQFAWSTTGAPGTADIQTVVLHEFGHWLNLRDLYGDRPGYPQDVAKVMYGRGTLGTTKRALDATASAGIRYIYGAAVPSPDKGIGAYYNGTWYLDANGNGAWDGPVIDRQTNFGNAFMEPVIGEWNGDGIKEIAVYYNGIWYVDYNRNGAWDGPVIDRQAVNFGSATMIPVTGDWNGDGITEIGVYYSGNWYLDFNRNGVWDWAGTDVQCNLGDSTMTPVVGDWNGDGKPELGVYYNGTWYLDINRNGTWDGIVTDRQYSFGTAAMIPVTGDWNSDGVTEIGCYQNGTWYLDYNRNGVWDGPVIDQQFSFGTTGMAPVVR